MTITPDPTDPFEKVNELAVDAEQGVGHAVHDRAAEVLDRSVLTLAEGSASGPGACNRYNASYTLDGDALAFGPNHPNIELGPLLDEGKEILGNEMAVDIGDHGLKPQIGDLEHLLQRPRP